MFKDNKSLLADVLTVMSSTALWDPTGNEEKGSNTAQLQTKTQDTATGWQSGDNQPMKITRGVTTGSIPDTDRTQSMRQDTRLEKQFDDSQLHPMSPGAGAQGSKQPQSMQQGFSSDSKLMEKQTMSPLTSNEWKSNDSQPQSMYQGSGTEWKPAESQPQSMTQGTSSEWKPNDNPSQTMFQGATSEWTADPNQPMSMYQGSASQGQPSENQSMSMDQGASSGLEQDDSQFQDTSTGLDLVDNQPSSMSQEESNGNNTETHLPPKMFQ